MSFAASAAFGTRCGALHCHTAALMEPQTRPLHRIARVDRLFDEYRRVSLAPRRQGGRSWPGILELRDEVRCHEERKLKDQINMLDHERAPLDLPQRARCPSSGEDHVS